MKTARFNFKAAFLELYDVRQNWKQIKFLKAVFKVCKYAKTKIISSLCRRYAIINSLTSSLKTLLTFVVLDMLQIQ